MYIPVLSSSWIVNEMLHEWFVVIVNFFIIMLEFMGLVVIVYTAISSFISWMKKENVARHNLLEGLSTALSFKLGGEILRTVIVHELSEIVLVGAIIILRVALTLLIHWEIKHEEHEEVHSEKHENNT